MIVQSFFKWVALKHLIKGSDSAGAFSSHLVKIDANCILDTHCHEGCQELHEVVDGEGICEFDKERFAYHPGQMTLIPKGICHKVTAGEEGILLLAKFIPALI
ncbi:MAG: cupin domain-containing protein [Proteobacteria bacterium]|nr:cupin domain-containing protein [Pseudomonadota bacterium]MBU1585771.1 cupin domain-containing protein [Pseudomonadota bacterium]